MYFLKAFADPFEPQMNSGDIGYKAGDPDCQFVTPTSGAQGSYPCTLTVSNTNGMDVHHFNLVVDFPASVWTHTFGGNGDEHANSVFADALGNTDSGRGDRRRWSRQPGHPGGAL